MADALRAITGKARAIEAPPTSLSPLYPDADLLDAFAILLPEEAGDDVEALARIACERQAWWIRALTWTRDALVAIAGVKSTRTIAASAAPGRVIGFFPVLATTPTDIVLGADDRHLDFRALIGVRVDGSGRRELFAVTTVHCHNRFGRFYLAAIAPFHRSIVKANMERTVRTVRRSGAERVSA